MAEQGGEKSEKPTAKHLQEAWDKGQFARSAEIQTAFVLLGGLMALLFTGREVYHHLGQLMYSMLAHLHDRSVTLTGMQRFFIDTLSVAGTCLWPILASTCVAGLLASGLQTRFHTSSNALAVKWDRLNPVAGLQRIFSIRSAVPTLVSILKLTVIVTLSYNVVMDVLRDPIFFSSVDISRIGQFLVDSSFKICLRITFALVVVAALDYAYQLWRTGQDLMMTKAEVKDEHKNQEGDPKVKAKMRGRRREISQRKMMAAVPKADVIITNPTHLAIALRYDRKSMGAPRIIAKGSRLNALRIREIAKQHQIPIIENKPLARMMFKYGRVGGEIPAQLYVAVAEILAYVYRTNAYRYYREQNLPG